MTAIPGSAVPVIPRGVRLTEDKVRNRWVLLAPERILELDDIAQAILIRCDGLRDVNAISGDLARSYNADPAEIMTDVKEMLGDLAARHFVTL